MTTVTTSHPNHHPVALFVGLALFVLAAVATVAWVTHDSSSSPARPAVSTPEVTGSLSPDAIDRAATTSRADGSPDALDRAAPQASVTDGIQSVSPDAIDRVTSEPVRLSYGSADSLDR